ncbi:PGN_0703 family putative restriction endonuclease [Yeosuana marina]|uniref:PGN_0703 family putative restriction endonuclease n=1 Tax=Yeosuana marina TaxID=1565536 RepID=UPI0030C7B101
MSITKLKDRLKKNALNICNQAEKQGDERKTAVLFPNLDMSFHPETYANICSNPEYNKRLNKSHPKAKGYKEMQSSNSSDTLLMNIFAYPNTLENESLRNLLDVNKNDSIEFGWNPEFENETRKTEIDMKIGDTIFEAKLTEADFKKKHKKIVLAYEDVEQTLYLRNLAKGENVLHYQLIRNLLTAKKYNFKFNLIIEASRIDLINAFNEVKSSIKDNALASRFNFLTWQEITEILGDDLKAYILQKYF